MTITGSGSAAQVTLALPPDDLTDTLVELRGAEAGVRVLEALVRHDGLRGSGGCMRIPAPRWTPWRDLEAAGLVSIAEEMVWRDPMAGYDIQLDQALTLTDDQQAVGADCRRDPAGRAARHAALRRDRLR